MPSGTSPHPPASPIAESSIGYGRTWRVGVLVAALIVMLGQVPISALIWDRIPWASGLLLDVPNMAVKRAILFGICVGSVGTSLRVMFGIERSYMGGGQ